MFNQQELQVLLGGVNTPIDIEDLRRNTNYGGLYSDEEPTIRAFWKVRAVRAARSPFLSQHRSYSTPFLLSKVVPPLLYAPFSTLCDHPPIVR